MQNIDHMKWFRHVLDNIGGTPPVVQCAIVGPNNTIQLKISFDIPVRGSFRSSMSLEPPTPMLLIVERVALHHLRGLMKGPPFRSALNNLALIGTFYHITLIF
jgi:hypothetical protein